MVSAFFLHLHMAKHKIKLRPKNSSRLSAKSGMPTESFVYVGKDRPGEVHVKLIDYDGVALEEKTIDTISECELYKDKSTVTWLAVSGVHQSDKIQEICNLFHIHPLIQEDILNTQQRTKIEEFEDYLFVTFKHIYYTELSEVETEQVSVILGKNFVISFQESEGRLFDDILNRIKTAKGTIRTKKSDYLLYKILDTAVDQYFVLIDIIEDKLEDLEFETLHHANSMTPVKIQALKKNLQIMGKHILPMREALNKLEAGSSDLIEAKNLNYYRDVYDHTYQAYDTIENQKNLLNDLTNLYYNTMSNKLNQVMKLLTIISTIFMPLSFITGVFGMNFKFFPGMDHPHAIYYFSGICLSISLFMLIYFRWKRWF